MGYLPTFLYRCRYILMCCCCRDLLLQIKRAFRTLRTRAHPDKGGDADEFHRLVTAYNVLSDTDKVNTAGTVRVSILYSRVHAVLSCHYCIVVSLAAFTRQYLTSNQVHFQGTAGACC